MSRITIKTLKPRNPVAALARARKAGAHGANESAMRHQARRALRRELAQLAPEPHRLSP